jgi:lambda family phage portal protein
MGFIKPDKDASDPEGVDELAEDQEQTDLDGEPVVGRRRGATRPEEIVVEPLAWNRLHPGEDIATFKSEHPNAIVPEFTNLMLQGIASGVGGLHYEIANNLEGVNYTSSRAGQLTQQDIWRLLQELVIQDLHAPIYFTALRLALLRGAIELPGGRRARPVGPYAEVDHRGRGWTTMNTLQDSQNHALRIACGLRSRHQVMAEDNEDFDETLEELAEEQQKAAALGVSIAPPGSLAADVEAALLEDEKRRADEEARSKGSKDGGATPKANSNGNGTVRNHNGSEGVLSVPARAPRIVASRF